MKNDESAYWHTLSGDEVFSRMGTNLNGLSNEEVATRLQRYGPNTIKTGKETSAWKLLLHQIASPLVYVLLAAMVVTIAIQHWADAIVIGVVVALVTFKQP